MEKVVWRRSGSGWAECARKESPPASNDAAARQSGSGADSTTRRTGSTTHRTSRPALIVTPTATTTTALPARNFQQLRGGPLGRTSYLAGVANSPDNPDTRQPDHI